MPAEIRRCSRANNEYDTVIITGTKDLSTAAAKSRHQLGEVGIAVADLTLSQRGLDPGRQHDRARTQQDPGVTLSGG